MASPLQQLRDTLGMSDAELNRPENRAVREKFEADKQRLAGGGEQTWTKNPGGYDTGYTSGWKAPTQQQGPPQVSQQSGGQQFDDRGFPMHGMPASQQQGGGGSPPQEFKSQFKAPQQQGGADAQRTAGKYLSQKQVGEQNRLTKTFNPLYRQRYDDAVAAGGHEQYSQGALDIANQMATPEYYNIRRNVGGMTESRADLDSLPNASQFPGRPTKTQQGPPSQVNLHGAAKYDPPTSLAGLSNQATGMPVAPNQPGGRYGVSGMGIASMHNSFRPVSAAERYASEQAAGLGAKRQRDTFLQNHGKLEKLNANRAAQMKMQQDMANKSAVSRGFDSYDAFKADANAKHMANAGGYQAQQRALGGGGLNSLAAKAQKPGNITLNQMYRK